MPAGQTGHEPPGAGLGASGWTVEEAATELADRDRGYDFATARTMVEEYIAGGIDPQYATSLEDVRLDDLDVDLIIAIADHGLDHHESLESGYRDTASWMTSDEGYDEMLTVPDELGSAPDTIYTDTVRQVMSDSHGVVLDAGPSSAPLAGAHSHAVIAIRAELERAFGGARTAGRTPTVDAGDEVAADAAGVDAGYEGLAGGAAWAVADEQTAAQQHMPSGYDTA
jgi:hypothetical protein